MTSGLEELAEEASCASPKQPCSSWHMGKRDTNVTKDGGEVQTADATGRRGAGQRRQQGLSKISGRERCLRALERWAGVLSDFLTVSHHGHTQQLWQ